MNIQKMMKQAAKMQEQLTASLAEKTIQVSVGGEKVTVTANGLGDIVGIKIAKEVVDPEVCRDARGSHFERSKAGH